MKDILGDMKTKRNDWWIEYKWTNLHSETNYAVNQIT